MYTIDVRCACMRSAEVPGVHLCTLRVCVHMCTLCVCRSVHTCRVVGSTSVRVCVSCTAHRTVHVGLCPEGGGAWHPSLLAPPPGCSGAPLSHGPAAHCLLLFPVLKSKLQRHGERVCHSPRASCPTPCWAPYVFSYYFFSELVLFSKFN